MCPSTLSVPFDFSFFLANHHNIAPKQNAELATNEVCYEVIEASDAKNDCLSKQSSAVSSAVSITFNRVLLLSALSGLSSLEVSTTDQSILGLLCFTTSMSRLTRILIRYPHNASHRYCRLLNLRIHQNQSQHIGQPGVVSDLSNTFWVVANFAKPLLPPPAGFPPPRWTPVTSSSPAPAPGVCCLLTPAFRVGSCFGGFR